MNLTWILDHPEDDGINVTVYLQWNGTNPSFSYGIMIDVIPDLQPVPHHVTSHQVNSTTSEITLNLKVQHNIFYNVSIVAKYLCEQSIPVFIGLYHSELITTVCKIIVLCN